LKIILVANTDWYLFNFKRKLMEALRENDVELVLISPGGEYAHRLIKAGYRHLNWHVGRKSMTPWYEWNSISQIKAIYAREKPDLVQHFTVKPVLYGSIAAIDEHVPALCNAITGRGYLLESPDRMASLIRPFIWKLYQRAFLHENSRVIFETPADEAFFLENNVVRPGQNRLIEGVGVDEIRFSPRPEPAGIPVITYVGRLLQSKGIETLVEAARKLKSVCSFRLVFAGDTDPGNPTSISQKQIQEWVEAGLVEWIGWQSDMNKVYAQSNLVVLPSLTEGVPTVLLEAAASGRAIVASDIPGCRIVVEDGLNGLIVPVNDAEALAAALERLIKDADLRQQMGKAGRERVLNHFTASHIVAETLQVYNELLGADLKLR
jgi:glycosyltransferase involved in cell wall biosynthesis